MKLDFITQKTSVKAEKLHGLPLETHGMILAGFLFQDSIGRIWFFKETFLLADTSIKVVLKMLLLFFSNINIKFAKLKKLTWRLYTTAETLSITCQVKLIDKREFVKTALDKNFETFVVHIAAQKITTIHCFQVVQIAALQWDKAFTQILAKYYDYADIFWTNLAIKLPENTSINKHAITLIWKK